MVKNLFLVCVTIISFLGSCGHSPKMSTLGTPHQITQQHGVIDLLPKDAKAAIFVNMQQIRSARLYQEINKSIDNWKSAIDKLSKDIQKELDVEDEQLWTLLEKIDWFASFTLNGAAPQQVFFLKGTLSNEDVKLIINLHSKDIDDVNVLFMKKILKSDKNSSNRVLPEAKLKKKNGYHIFDSGDMAATLINQNFIILAPMPMLTQVLERLDAPKVTKRHRVPFETQFTTFNHQILVAAEDITTLGQNKQTPNGNSEKQTPSTFEKWFTHTDDLFFKMNINSGVTMDAIIESNSSVPLLEVKQHIENEILKFTDTEYVKVFGFRELLKQITILDENGRLRFSLHLDELEAHLFWGRISGVISASIFAYQMIEQLMGGLSTMSKGLKDINSEPTNDEPTVPNNN